MYWVEFKEIETFDDGYVSESVRCKRIDTCNKAEIFDIVYNSERERLPEYITLNIEILDINNLYVDELDADNLWSFRQLEGWLAINHIAECEQDYPYLVDYPTDVMPDPGIDEDSYIVWDWKVKRHNFHINNQC